KRQLDALDGSTLHDNASDVDVVVLSIGGNDAGFGDIVKTCLEETNCQRNDQQWSSRLETISSKLKAVYDAVEAKTPDARRIVMTYPEILVPSGCVPGLEGNEIRWV